MPDQFAIKYLAPGRTGVDMRNRSMETDAKGKFVSFKVVFWRYTCTVLQHHPVSKASSVAVIGALKQLRYLLFQGCISEECSGKKFLCRLCGQNFDLEKEYSGGGPTIARSLS